MNVVAHEIAHSWTGNLVTNKNFEHFWLNEGFTVFIERKILGRLLSPMDQDFQALEGLADLKNCVCEIHLKIWYLSNNNCFTPWQFHYNNRFINFSTILVP